MYTQKELNYDLFIGDAVNEIIKNSNNDIYFYYFDKNQKEDILFLCIINILKIASNKQIYIKPLDFKSFIYLLKNKKRYSYKIILKNKIKDYVSTFTILKSKTKYNINEEDIIYILENFFNHKK